MRCTIYRLSGHPPPPLVILPDVAVGLLEQLFIRMQLVFEEGFAQGLLDFTLTGLRALPARETDQSHNLVDVRDHAFYHDGRLGRLDLVE